MFYKRSGIYFPGLFSFLLAILGKRSRVEVLSQGDVLEEVRDLFSGPLLFSQWKLTLKGVESNSP